jgi:hypothetical protein
LAGQVPGAGDAVASVLLAVLFALSVTAPLPAQGRRVVDIVKVGDAVNEREHGYAGELVTEGVADGRTFRQTHGWLGYSMAVYDDTEVTLSCVFRGTERRRLPFELLVEGRQIKTYTLVSSTSRPTNVDFPIPFEVTKGLTAIHVVLRAVDGPTPGLLELRTVQEHLERPSLRDISYEVPGSPTAAF